MSVVYDILMTTGKIFSFVLVLFAFGVSSLILFKPALALALNRKFNSIYSTKGLGSALDRNISITENLLRHRFKLGIAFLVSSAFVLWYLLVQFDMDLFIHYVIQPVAPKVLVVVELVLKIFVWMIIFGSFMGLLSGLMILAVPEKFKQLSAVMDNWFSTQPVVDTLEKSHSTVDEWVIKHHLAMGVVLFLGSIFLVFVCAQMFLK